MLILPTHWYPFVASLARQNTVWTDGIFDNDLVAAIAAFYLMCSLYLFDMSIQSGIYLGAFIGLILSAVLFFCVPWYHSMIIWQWTHLWPVTVIGVSSGVAAALLTD